MRLYLAIALALLVAVAHCKPVDDDSSSAAPPADEKKDTVENADSSSKPADESSALSDNPITDPSSDDSAGKRELTTTTTTTTTPAPETTTTTPGPDATTTTPAPEGVDEPTVEGSDNNTRTLKGTTFHVAIMDKSVQYYDEMNTNMHDIHRHDFMTVIAKVYEDYPEYKQAVIIKFSKPGKDSKADSRATIPDSDGVIVDFYLRFYTAGKHLAKLTDVLKTGKLFTHDVHPLFIRAYVAEPTGLVCTPDCKVQCYSYCDAGCCHLNIVQNIQLPTPSPVEEFIQNQQHALKTGQTTPKPCEADECKPQEQEQQQPMIMPMPMGMPQQMPCQGAACAPPMMMPMQMPCQGAACQPPMQMPCQGAACAPPMPPPMPCQGAVCQPPMQMPCQGAACAPPMQMPMQMPCQGAACAPPMQMPMQMPCQGAACQPPMMQMPMQMPQMCPPSCGQICAPSCPNQCCTPGRMPTQRMAISRNGR